MQPYSEATKFVGRRYELQEFCIDYFGQTTHLAGRLLRAYGLSGKNNGRTNEVFGRSCHYFGRRCHSLAGKQ